MGIGRPYTLLTTSLLGNVMKAITLKIMKNVFSSKTLNSKSQLLFLNEKKTGGRSFKLLGSS